ncbi:MAG: hypothetical protein IPM54_42120 [Polyangiaceae bacterium]|nr:hypothetical protein [Polyangiaceae bacterium]
MRNLAFSSLPRALVLALVALCAGGCGPVVVVEGTLDPDGNPPHPPVDLTPPPCDRPAIDGTDDLDPFDRLVYGFAGHYRGMANPPAMWGQYDEYPVDIHFAADGHYKAECLWEDCTAFYYGSNNDVPQKTYEVDDMLDDGTGVASIRISFDDTGGSVTTGTLREIVVSEDFEHLTFEFYPTWLGMKGPILYDLKCTVP